MGRVGARLFATSLALAACAGPGTPSSETPASKASAQTSSTCRDGSQPLSKWREMTLDEYYADVSERAARRGVHVIWVSRPDVREARKAEPRAEAVSACIR